MWDRPIFNKVVQIVNKTWKDIQPALFIFRKNAIQKISDGMHAVSKSLKFKQTTRTTEEEGEKAEPICTDYLEAKVKNILQK